MVNTVKFSQFATLNLTQTNQTVGLGNGANVIGSSINIWTTATRPSPAPNGVLGLNTDLQEYEFWSATDDAWVQIGTSGDVAALIARLASHLIGDGASMIGLQNQGITVVNKTVQDLANAAFIVQTNNGSLVNAQALGSLSTGILKSTTATGVLSISAPLTSIDALSTSTNEMLYLTGANTYATIAASASSVLVTSAGSVPSFSQTLPSAVQVSVGSLNSGTSASATTFWRGDGTWATVASSAGAALTEVSDTNVTLTLGGTPATALLVAASITAGWTGQLAISRGGTAVSSVTTSPTASAWAGWDANSNLSANNFIEGYTTTVTSASPVTLTVASTYNQFFTGSTNQTVTLPVTSTLTLGFQFYIVNNSTAIVTVNSSGGNAVQVMQPNTALYVTCILTSGTTAASWFAETSGVSTDLFPNGTVTVTASTQTIANGTAYIANHAGGVTFTLPPSSVNSYFAIIGMQGWTLSLSNGQSVTIGEFTANGSSVGSWQSVTATDSAIFLCTASNTWQAVSLNGNPVTAQGVTALSTGLMPKVTVVSSSQAMSPNTSYFCNAGASLITYTLPTTLNAIASSTRVAVYGQTGGSSGGWKINSPSGGQIIFGNNLSTTTTGNIASTTAGDWVVLDYIGGNWQVTACGGAPKLDTGGTVWGLAIVNNGVLVTSATGVQSVSTTLPSGLSATNLGLTTPTLGTPSSGNLSSCSNLPIGTTFTTGLSGGNVTNSTPLMAGFAVTNTVKGSNAFVTFCGQVSPGSGGNPQIGVRYGTGTPPMQGASVTGTLSGTIIAVDNNNGTIGFSKTVLVTGLTPSTTYWFDMQLAQTTGSSNAALQNTDCSILSF